MEILNVNPSAILIFLVVLCLTMLGYTIFLHRNLVCLQDRYNSLMRGSNNLSLETMLTTRLTEIDLAKVGIKKNEQQISELRESLRKCVQKIGIVRFNAFEHEGSDLSYAIAVMDENENGFVLSSIFGRSEARTYAKPIVNAVSNYKLTDEEEQALVLAKNNHKK